jgi:uncharacterized paraquat-inducible protein A
MDGLLSTAGALALIAIGSAVVWGLPAAVIAEDRGRSAAVYFIFGMLLGPLAIVHALVQPRTFHAELRRQEAQGRHRCAHCSAFVYQDAPSCPYCHEDLTHQRTVEDLEAAS